MSNSGAGVKFRSRESNSGPASCEVDFGDKLSLKASKRIAVVTVFVPHRQRSTPQQQQRRLTGPRKSGYLPPAAGEAAGQNGRRVGKPRRYFEGGAGKRPEAAAKKAEAAAIVSNHCHAYFCDLFDI